MRRLGAGGAALGLLAAVSFAASANGGQSANPSCQFTPSTGALEITSPNSAANTFIGVDESGAIYANEHTYPARSQEVVTPIPCSSTGAAPTVSNTDSVSAVFASTAVVGPLGPGRTAEDGLDEIEVTLDGPSASIIPASGDAHFHFGADAADVTYGANLNASQETSATSDADIIFTGPAAVLVLPGDGVNVVVGTGFPALPEPFPGTLRGYGGSGEDVFINGIGPVGFYAGEGGSDILIGGGGEDELLGGGGRDRISGEGGKDELTGNGEDDRIFGGNGADVVLGSAGDDRITGGDGRDSLLGAAGEDQLFARDGTRDAKLSCSKGDDSREKVRRDRKDPAPIGC